MMIIVVGDDREIEERGNTLSGFPIAESLCLFCSGSANTVAVKAKAAAMVLMKCIISMFRRMSFLHVDDVNYREFENG